MLKPEYHKFNSQNKTKRVWDVMEGEGLEFNPQCNNKKENIEVEGNDSFLEYLLTFPLKPKSTFYIIDF